MGAIFTGAPDDPDDVHDPPEVRQALEHMDVAALLEELEVGLGSARGDMVDLTKCPFHDGGGGAATIVAGPSAGWTNCFVCGGRGILSLIATVRNITRDEAQAWFQSRFGLDRRIYPDPAKVLEEVESQRASAKRADPPQREMHLPRSFDPASPWVAWHLQAVRWFPPEDVAGVAARCGLGYCGSGYYSHSLVLPILDAGRLVGYEAQAVDRQSVIPAAGKRKAFPKGFKAHRHLYGLERAVSAASEGQCCIVVEGPWDAVRLLEWGWPAVACFGSNLGHEQASVLIRHFRSVLFCFDLDLHKPPNERRQRLWEVKAAAVVGAMVRVGFVRMPDDPSLYHDGKGDPGGAVNRDVVAAGMGRIHWL